MKRIKVAVGIVFDESGRMLVGQRTVKDAYYGKWEFPGGKLEPDETAKQALIREFQEEVGITVSSSEDFLVLEHDYPDRNVTLFIEKVISYTGNVKPMEGQPLKWVCLDQLTELDFLSGNKEIIKALIAKK